MEYIIDYIKTYNYKKLLFPIIFILLYIFEFIYFENKINNKKITTIENIIVEKQPLEEIQKEEVITEYIYVDVKGAVKKPGVYKLEAGSRVIDVINISGGLIKTSNTNYTNLSKVLNDSEIVKIYTNEEVKKMEKENIEIQIENKEQNNTNDLININKASIEELKTLNGIGESKAKSIIEYRNTNGEFKSIVDIKNVEGISDSLFEKIKDSITI